MNESEANIFNLYDRVVSDEFVQATVSELGVRVRNRIFPCALVMWLMIFQRLDSNHSLSKILELVKEGDFDSLLSRKGAFLSSGTSGYAHARERLPLELVHRTADKISDALVAMHKEERWKGLKVYLIDGSSWTLPGTESIKEKYSACENQYGQSVWSKVRTLHVHDLVTGVAMRPAYGPMFGDSAVGELTLLPEVLGRVEKEAVFVADRLFGCFQVAYALTQEKREGLLRMSDDRAGKFLKQLKRPGEVRIRWQPSKHERRKHSHLPEDACVEGRFIWYRLERKGYKPQDFYFFTTLELSMKDVMELYSLRWNIETDLRNIKSTMELAEIRSKSPDMVAKEIVLGHVAYNLVRNVMLVMARLAKIDPRDLSFSRFVTFITVSAPNMLIADRKTQHEKIAARLRDIKYYMLPKQKRETQPRKALFRRKKYPVLQLPREIEVELMKIRRLAA